MKRIKVLKKYATLFLLFCMISISTYHSAPPAVVSASIVQPMSDYIGWMYKEVNGKYYKRLYNFTSRTWIGEWIPVNKEH